MSKIGYVNYARFPKSGHIYIHTYIHIESCELKAQVEHHHTVKNDTKLYFAIFPQQRLNYVLLEVITNK